MLILILKIFSFGDVCFKGAAIVGCLYFWQPWSCEAPCQWLYVKVNCVGPEKGDTPLHRACRFGHVQVTQALLRQPGVGVNAGNVGMATPLYFACQEGKKEVVSLLLADKRIDVNKPDRDQWTPLWVASQNGHLPVVQLILASGREIDTKTKSIAGPAAENNKTAAERARFQGTREKQNGPSMADLIDSYEQNPQQIRTQLRKQLGLKGRSFFVFFFVVFLLFFFSLESGFFWFFRRSPLGTDSSR